MRRNDESASHPMCAFRDFSPAPRGSGASPMFPRAAPQMRRQPSPMQRDASPLQRDVLATQRDAMAMRPDVSPMPGWRDSSACPGRPWSCLHFGAQPLAAGCPQGSSSTVCPKGPPSPMCSQGAYGTPAADPNFLRRSFQAPSGPPCTGNSPALRVTTGTADVRWEVDVPRDPGPTSRDEPEEWIPSPRMLALSQPWQPQQFRCAADEAQTAIKA